jgi:hypothetical protein
MSVYWSGFRRAQGTKNETLTPNFPSADGLAPLRSRGESSQAVIAVGVGGMDSRTGIHKHLSHTKGGVLETEVIRHEGDAALPLSNHRM